MRLKCFLLTITFAVVASPVGATPITLINQGFEDGLDGWVPLGEVNAVPYANIDPGNFLWYVSAAEFGMAQVDTGDSATVDIETFLGIASGSFDAAIGDILAATDSALTVGSAIYQDFSGNVGDTLTQYWNFVTRDYADYNDLAMAVVVPPTGPMEITVLATIWNGALSPVTVGDVGASGWLPFNYTLDEGGEHRIAFIAMNSDDDTLDSVLFLDNAAGATVNLTLLDPIGPLPEPATLVLVGLGLAAIAVNVRRRRQ